MTPGGCLLLRTGELVPALTMGPTTRVTPGDPALCLEFLAWVRQEVAEHPIDIHRFVYLAMLGEGYGPRMIAKGDLEKQDLVGLWKILEYVLGDYAGRISRYGWLEWPGRLDSREREMLGTARLIFLPSIEKHERFPQAALEEMLTDTEFGWFSSRGRNYPCGARFFYPAPLRKLERLENNLVPKIHLLPAPRANVRPAPPEQWLPAEAPHILAWLLTPEGKR